jgi:hypothetical protein
MHVRVPFFRRPRVETYKPSIETETESTLPPPLLDEASRSAAALILLPQTIAEDGIPLFAGSMTSVRKLLHEQGITTAVLPNGSARYREDRSFEWVGPTMFVSLAMYSQNRAVVDVALNVIGSYVYDLFHGGEKDVSVKLDILCFRGLGISVRRLKYRGPVEGLKKLSDSVHETMDKADE